jgi:hypothetical protein
MQKIKELAIDAVITWVDSSDKVWQQKINKYLQQKIDWDNKKDSTRYNSVNEIEITILSIIKFAPFIKNIFLVTDNQQPENFIKLKNIAEVNNVNLELVDHTIIFRNHKKYLPSFNSCSIITMLYQVPNLSEQFIIFNDDTFLMRETKPEDFFKNGLPIIRGRWDSFYEDKFFRSLFIRLKFIFKKIKVKETGYKLAQQKSAKILGLEKYIRRDHTPVSVRKSILEEFFNENPAFLDNNIKHRFRDNTQFIISSLSNHLEVKKGSYILKKYFQLSYFQSYNYIKTKLKLAIFKIQKGRKFMCFQSLELAPEKTLKLILNFIDTRLETNFTDTNQNSEKE